jgi:uncharacterized protein (DUF2141 family)
MKWRNLGHCLVLSVLFYIPFLNNGNGTLQIKIEGAKANKGKVYLAMYCKEENFLDEKITCRRAVITLPEQGPCIYNITDMSFGKYAIAVYQDQNSNGKMDNNVFGIPTEPFGFSNNPSAKWHKPKYQEAVFDFKEDRQTIGIQVKAWSKQ